MEKYTVGIYFRSNVNEVALILKNRPTWQAGKYNFPGGKIEFNESPLECTIREFNEECCVNTIAETWNHIGRIENDGNYTVEIYTGLHKSFHGDLITGEDQKVQWFNVNDLPRNIISNLSWLIPFAVNYWKQGNADYIKFGNFEYSYTNKPVLNND